MDLLKAQLDRLQKQLAGLNSSQKMLTASLLAIMIMTLIWWGRYAGEPEMVAVLDQSFSADDISRITADLATRNIPYSVAGDRILVPVDRKVEVLASLSYSHLLPRDTSTGFTQMLQQMNPLQPDSTTDKMFNRAKEMMLSQIIEDFPQVASADVLIDPTQVTHVEGSVDPSATITIAMRDGIPAAQQLVDAAADVVQGAQSGLSRSRIKVVVDGKPRRLHDAENGDGDLDGQASDQLEAVQKAELLQENKIKELLSYIADLKVIVTVKVNSTSIQEQKRDFDGKKAVQKETETTNDSVESNTPSSISAEPGVVSNVGGISIPGAAPAGGASTNTETKDTAKFQNFVPEDDTVSKTPAGDATALAATVRVPEAYFAAIYTQQNPTVKEPTEQQLQPLIGAELPKIRTDVMKCTGLTAESDVAVETYVDVAPMVAAAPQAAALSVTNLVGVHGKELTLGGLAVMSLFMVSMMVRKGTPALAPPIVAAPVGAAPAGLAEEGLVGEAADGRNLLAGMELDEDAVRNQQMLDQVSSMVKENPDAAASLVKRWLNRT